MIKNKVSIIGLGYVGLPTACVIAQNPKYEVFGFDIDEKKIKAIKNRTIKIDDLYAEKLIGKVRLHVSENPEIIKNSEFIIVAVPTPVSEKKKPDLRPLKNAVRLIAKYLEKGQKIIIESTINPGVCEEIVLPILEKTKLKGGINFELSHCPERINPGDPVFHIKNINRNIGSLTKKGNKIVADFYRSFIDGLVNEVSSLKTSEATKIIENTFRDVNIAFVNELAKSFDKFDLDVVEVIKAASNKPFAFMAHFPSRGVGGHCIPVDPYYLIKRAEENGFEHVFLKKAREINESMPHYTVQLLEEKLKEKNLTIKTAKIALLGMSYKENVADLRESPSLTIKKILKKKKADFHTFDPLLPEQSSMKSLEKILDFADTIILSTYHDQFRALSPSLLKKHNIQIVIDGKNCLNKDAIKAKNIIYKGIGR